jgi:hypothetical protein
MINFKTIVLGSIILVPLAVHAQTPGSSPGFTVTMSGDHKYLVIHTDKCATGTGQCVTEMQFDGPATDFLVTKIGEYRQQMDAPIPEMSQDDSKPFNIAIANPGRLYVQAANPEKSVVNIAILHPSYGWVGLQVTAADIPKIIQELQAQRLPKQ